MDPSMLRPEHVVRKARAADVPRLARAMARAFHDDPLSSWYFPAVGRRTPRLAAYFEGVLRRVALPHHETWTTDEVVGGALWMPPGQWRAPRLAVLRQVPTMIRVFGLRLPRALQGLRWAERNHPREPHYYLSYVGVAPEWQGKGIGSALLRPVLDRCDTEGLPAYLEASSSRNVPLYQRLGFTIRQEASPFDSGPRVWMMWREPKT